MAKTLRTTPKIVELYVEVQDIEPLIWRRLLVPLSITLPKLHDFLQIALGWTDSHLHSFTFGERSFSMPYDEFFDELEMEDERRKTLGGVLGSCLREPVTDACELAINSYTCTLWLIIASMNLQNASADHRRPCGAGSAKGRSRRSGFLPGIAILTNRTCAP